MENKSNKGLIGLVVVLIIMVLGLGGYIVYDKVFSIEKENKKVEKETTNKQIKEEKVEIKNQDVENYLNKYMETFLYFYKDFTKATTRVAFVAYNLTIDNQTKEIDGTMGIYVEKSVFKDKYLEIYGEGNYDFDKDVEEASKGKNDERFFDDYSTDIGNDYYAWIGSRMAYAPAPFKFTVSNVSYDKKNKIYISKGSYNNHDLKDGQTEGNFTYKFKLNNNKYILIDMTLE